MGPGLEQGRKVWKKEKDLRWAFGPAGKMPVRTPGPYITVSGFISLLLFLSLASC